MCAGDDGACARQGRRTRNSCRGAARGSQGKRACDAMQLPTSSCDTPSVRNTYATRHAVMHCAGQGAARSTARGAVGHCGPCQRLCGRGGGPGAERAAGGARGGVACLCFCTVGLVKVLLRRLANCWLWWLLGRVHPAVGRVLPQDATLHHHLHPVPTLYGHRRRARARRAGCRTCLARRRCRSASVRSRHGPRRTGETRTCHAGWVGTGLLGFRV